jgi:hypothetical protein
MKREEDIQNYVLRWLEKYEIYPYKVIYTNETRECGLLGITFFLKSDLESFLEIIGYKALCDKSGILLYPENNTILLSGMSLLTLIT